MVPRKSALGFIFATVLIDVIGWGIIIPVVPDLIAKLGHEDMSHAARDGGLLTITYAAMQFLCSPILGGLSDKFGRRPILLFSLLGFGLDYVFQGLSPTLGWLFMGRAIAGITGASFTTASAYIADISEPEKRAQNFGLLGAAFGLGFIIGPLIGSFSAHWGQRAPFMVAGGLSLLNFIYGYFVLPESLTKENRRPFSWKRANPIGSLMQLRKYPVVSGLVVALTLVYIGAHAVQSNWNFYTKFRFNWSDSTVGYSLTVVGLLIALVQAVLIRVVTPKIGAKNSVYAGLTLYSIGMLLFAFANQGWMMFAILVPYCLGGICGPALQGIISGQVPANGQGELQGALTSLMSATSIIGPGLMNFLFYFFSRKSAPVYLPGAPFLMGAILFTASIFFAAYTLKRRYTEPDASAPIQQH